MGRSGYRQRSAWELVQLRAWTGPMEKMPRRGEGPIWHRTAKRQAEFCCIRYPLSWNVHPHERLVPHSRRDSNVTSLRSKVTAYPFTVVLRDHVDYHAAKLPE
jgi:hypothetical protein